MSEPVYVVDCPYCSSMVVQFKDSPTATCRACGGVMKIIHPDEKGYSDAKMELTQLKKVMEKRKDESTD